MKTKGKVNPKKRPQGINHLSEEEGQERTWFQSGYLRKIQGEAIPLPNSPLPTPEPWSVNSEVYNQETDGGGRKVAQVCFLSHSSTQANPKVVFLCRAKEAKQACSEFKMTSVIHSNGGGCAGMRGERSLSVHNSFLGSWHPWGVLAVYLEPTWPLEAYPHSYSPQGERYECFASKSCYHLWTLRQGSRLAGLGGWQIPSHTVLRFRLSLVPSVCASHPAEGNLQETLASEDLWNDAGWGLWWDSGRKLSKALDSIPGAVWAPLGQVPD